MKVSKSKRKPGNYIEKVKCCLFDWVVLIIGFIAFLFFIIFVLIGVDVRKRCLEAKSQYEGDCVEALIQVVDADYNGFAERNRAIWALGQIGDIRAKEVLEKYYTGNIPNREPYNEVLSQYEMKKALKLLNGGFNITHYVWDLKDLE